MSEQSTSIGELATALCKAQAAIGGAKKDSTNPFFKSNYADLQSVWDACREQLGKNGLAVVQTTELNESGVTIVTTLTHSSGEWMRGKLNLHPTKNDPQGIGSAITYGRRYALAAIVGIYQTDDDGNAASVPREAEVQAKRVITGTITDIATNDKGTFYKLDDDGTENICTTKNQAFVKKLAGAHGLYAELSVHSEDVGKAKLIVDVLHIAEPELGEKLEKSMGGINDESGEASGMVKKYWPSAGKKPMAVSLMCNGIEYRFSTFHKTPDDRLKGCEGKFVELTFKYDGQYRTIEEVKRVGDKTFTEEELFA